MLAVCHALLGLRVDVITSSKVLAIRDSQKRTGKCGVGLLDFYGMFGIGVGNNCDEDCESPHIGEVTREKNDTRTVW